MYTISITQKTASCQADKSRFQGNRMNRVRNSQHYYQPTYGNDPHKYTYEKTNLISKSSQGLFFE